MKISLNIPLAKKKMSQIENFIEHSFGKKKKCHNFSIQNSQWRDRKNIDRWETQNKDMIIIFICDRTNCGTCRPGVRDKNRTEKGGVYPSGTSNKNLMERFLSKIVPLSGSIPVFMV